MSSLENMFAKFMFIFATLVSVVTAVQNSEFTCPPIPAMPPACICDTEKLSLTCTGSSVTNEIVNNAFTAILTAIDKLQMTSSSSSDDVLEPMKIKIRSFDLHNTSIVTLYIDPFRQFSFHKLDFSHNPSLQKITHEDPSLENHFVNVMGSFHLDFCSFLHVKDDATTHFRGYKSLSIEHNQRLTTSESTSSDPETTYFTYIEKTFNHRKTSKS